MEIVLLDFSDGIVKIIDNIPEGLQMEEIENILVNNYYFRLDEIEFMVVPKLRIEYL